MAARRSESSDAVLAARRMATVRSLAPLMRFAPSLRSLLIGLAVLGLAAGAYAAARETSLFAVRTIDVRGGTPAIRARVRAALAHERGVSLLRVDGAALARRLADISAVRSFTFDRDFPHTLRVVVHRERAALVVRQGRDGAYVVAASGRVLRTLSHPRRSSLPRLWLPTDVHIDLGRPLPDGLAGAAAAVAAARHAGLPGGVREVRDEKGSFALELGAGLELRIGPADDLHLKLVIARRILQATGAAAGGRGYLDVSVPERPVLNPNPQVEG